MFLYFSVRSLFAFQPLLLATVYICVHLLLCTVRNQTLRHRRGWRPLARKTNCGPLLGHHADLVYARLAENAQEW